MYLFSKFFLLVTLVLVTIATLMYIVNSENYRPALVVLYTVNWNDILV